MSDRRLRSIIFAICLLPSTPSSFTTIFAKSQSLFLKEKLDFVLESNCSVSLTYANSDSKQIDELTRTCRRSSHNEVIFGIRGGSLGSQEENGNFKYKDYDDKDLITEEKEISLLSRESERGMTLFLFSDVDGTLVHYPNESPAIEAQADAGEETNDNFILNLPPSSTGMRGIISSHTLSLSQKIRRMKTDGNGCSMKLILVSGMRTSTLMKRLPYLPRADAYASEAGSRIFYPAPVIDSKKEGDTVYCDASGERVIVKPQKYDGSEEEDLIPFSLKEDTNWRSMMSRIEAAGVDGYHDGTSDPIPLENRRGALWEFAQSLIQKGFVIDYKGYSSCFRVNRKQQNDRDMSKDSFDSLMSYDVASLGLARSVNLGCIDFYPKESGKKNCCAYLAKKFSESNNSQTNQLSGEEILSQRAVCLCDDDNDLEMAMACRKAFLPSVTSSSMANAASEYPHQIIITEKKEEDIVETAATEEALKKALKEFLDLSQLKP